LNAFRYLLLATVMDPRIKDRMFSAEHQVEIKALLVKEVNALNQLKDDFINKFESFDPPPSKVSKMSTSTSLMEQLLECKKQEYGFDEKASSKAIEVSHLKFD